MYLEWTGRVNSHLKISLSITISSERALDETISSERALDQTLLFDTVVDSFIFKINQSTLFPSTSYLIQIWDNLTEIAIVL